MKKVILLKIVVSYRLNTVYVVDIFGEFIVSSGDKFCFKIIPA